MKLWIARDKVGNLRMYDKKPIKDTGWFCATGDNLPILLYTDLFPDVVFENSPQEVEINLVRNETH